MRLSLVTEKVVYQNKWICLYDDAVRFPDGTMGTYIRLSYHGNPPGVVIIPQLPDGRLLLLRIFRYAMNEESLEFPRGGGQVGKKVEQLATEELQEETELVARSWTLLGSHRPDTAIMMTEACVLLAE